MSGGGGKPPPKPKLSVLYRFRGGADGDTPNGGLTIDADGNLYGTTISGGGSPDCSLGCGTVFRLRPPPADESNWKETVLHRFQGGTDGAIPQGGLIFGPSGALYGTTSRGGSDNFGTAYTLTGLGRHYAPIFIFGVPDQETTGSFPSGMLLAGDGVLYGAALRGGQHDQGAVFSLTPTAGQFLWSETVLHNFCSNSSGKVCVDGKQPNAAPVLGPDGALYGTGCAPDAVGGCVYQLTADGQLNLLHVFCSDPTCADGNNPTGLIVDAGGALYGTTSDCGSGGQPNCQGTVYRLSPPAEGQTDWVFTVLHRFCTPDPSCPDGKSPQAGLVMDASGVLYGVTLVGGDFDGGVVFKLTPHADGTYREAVLHSFAAHGRPQPSNPVGSLLLDPASGAIYGAAMGGHKCPVDFCGLIYKLAP